MELRNIGFLSIFFIIFTLNGVKKGVSQTQTTLRHSEKVILAQSFSNEECLHHGSIDGSFNLELIEAIKRIQKINNLPESGFLDDKTINLMKKPLPPHNNELYSE